MLRKSNHSNKQGMHDTYSHNLLEIRVPVLLWNIAMTTLELFGNLYSKSILLTTSIFLVHELNRPMN